MEPGTGAHSMASDGLLGGEMEEENGVGFWVETRLCGFDF